LEAACTSETPATTSASTRCKAPRMNISNESQLRPKIIIMMMMIIIIIIIIITYFQILAQRASIMTDVVSGFPQSHQLNDGTVYLPLLPTSFPVNYLLSAADPRRRARAITVETFLNEK
jgi:hypothetical protein